MLSPAFRLPASVFRLALGHRTVVDSVSAPARKLLTAPGLRVRAARHLIAPASRVLLPSLEPAAALRLTCYLAGLLCFDGLAEHLATIPAVAVVCVVVAWLSTQLPRRWRLLLYSGALLAVGVVGMTLPIGVQVHVAKLLVKNGLLVAGIVFCYVTCLSTLPARLGRLLPYSRVLLAVGLLGTVVLAGDGLLYIRHIPSVLTRPHHYQDDALAVKDCATQLFLGGHNPYTDFYLVDCLPRNGLNGDKVTPVQAGAFAHTRLYPTAQEMKRVFQQAVRHHVQRPAEFGGYFAYPAGSFIFPLPIMALGWHELGLFYLLCVLLAYLLLAWRAPPRLRAWLVPLALANLTIWPVWVQFGGRSDYLDTLFILAAWVAWRRPWLSAVLMGAAIATRQNAWFFVPFYAILIVRTYGWRALAQRGAVMAAVFALLNSPFVLQSPADWLNGVLGPLRAPLFAETNFGLTALTGRQWLWPRQTYTVLGLVAMAACALVYARLCRRQPGIGLVLAIVPFLVAWRSFIGYFSPLTIFCLWPLLEGLRSGPPVAIPQRWVAYASPERSDPGPGVAASTASQSR